MILTVLLNSAVKILESIILIRVCELVNENSISGHNAKRAIVGIHSYTILLLLSFVNLSKSRIVVPTSILAHHDRSSLRHIDRTRDRRWLRNINCMIAHFDNLIRKTRLFLTIKECRLDRKINFINR